MSRKRQLKTHLEAFSETLFYVRTVKSKGELIMLEKINLQLFAEPAETPIEEVKEEPVEEPVEEIKEEPIEEPKEESIPKSVALQWKKESKELKRKLREFEEKQLEQEQKNKTDKIRSLVIEKGYDEEMADVFSKVASELFSSMPKTDFLEAEILEDLEEYPELLKHKKEIIEKVKTYRKVDPKFSVEDAAKLLGTKKSQQDIETEIEQRQAMARRNTEGKQPTTSSAGPAAKSKLTDDEKRIVKRMQEEHPDAGWTEEKYYKLIKSKRS